MNVPMPAGHILVRRCGKLALPVLFCFFIFLLANQPWYSASIVGLIVLPFFLGLVPRRLEMLLRIATHPFLIFHLVFLSYSVLASLLVTGDLSFSRRYLYLLFSWVSSGAIVVASSLLFRQSFRELRELILDGVAICSTFFLLSLIFSSVREFFLSFLHLSDYELKLLSLQPYRFGGLTGFTGFGVSVTFALAFIFSIAKRDSGATQVFKLKLHLSRVVLAVGSFAAGRIGGTIVIGALLFLFLNNISWPRRIARIAVIFGATISILSLFYLGISLGIIQVAVLPKFLAWQLEPYLNLLLLGSFESASSDELLRMHFVPQFPTLLYGDFRYMSADGWLYYMNTDVGYLRLILFFGLPCSIGFYLSWLPIVSRIHLGLRTSSSNWIWFTLLALIAAELKGDYLFACAPGGRLLFLIFWSTIYSNLNLSGSYLFSRRSDCGSYS
jgi:hypothetical protein